MYASITDEEMDRLKKLLARLPERRLEEARQYIAGLIQVSRKMNKQEKNDE